jgi:hypothetical protein
LINSIAFAQKKDSVKYNPYSGSQQPKKTSILDDFYFGGNLYFTFGSYTSIGIWPSAGYKITPKLSVGIQPGYEYLKYDNYYGGTYESSNYGVRFFSRFRVIPQAYLHAEYATINYGFQSQNANGDIVESRDWVPFLFLGAGVSQSIGGRTFMYAQILFDVINDENSPYRNGEPFLSIGVVAGF